MPIAKRVVLTTDDLITYNPGGPETAPDMVLQTVAAQHMVGVIKQLSWLAGYASELFNGILVETGKTYDRIQVIDARTARAAEYAYSAQQKFASARVADFYANGGVRREWKNAETEQQLLSPASRPSSLEAAYVQATPSPRLELMDPFTDERTPGGCMQKYSHPGFFFEQWFQLLLAQKQKADEERAARKKEKKNKKGKHDLGERREATKVQKKVFKDDLGGIKEAKVKEKRVYGDWAPSPRFRTSGTPVQRTVEQPTPLQLPARPMISLNLQSVNLPLPPQVNYAPASAQAAAAAAGTPGPAPMTPSGGAPGPAPATFVAPPTPRAADPPPPIPSSPMAQDTGSFNAPPPPPPVQNYAPPPPPPVNYAAPPPPPPAGIPSAPPPMPQAAPPPPMASAPPPPPMQSSAPPAAPPMPPPPPPPPAPAMPKAGGGPPPPPPPAPAPGGGGGGGGGGGDRGDLLSQIAQGTKLRAAEPVAPKQEDPTNALLGAIRAGNFGLKDSKQRVLADKPSANQNQGGYNVAALMAAMDNRRAVIDDSDDEDDDDEWA